MYAVQALDRVLVVEDERPAREALVMLLEYEGYDVRSAEGGDEALQIVGSWTPDVVVTDVCMPRGHGFRLVTDLRRRQECQDAAILLVSARDDVRRRVSGLDLGADDFIAKPINPEELLARIRAHLRTTERRRKLSQDCATDPTTSLLNRRGLEAALNTEIERAQRSGGFSILLLDLDRFKLINDTYGHDVGDEVLQRVGENLQKATRTVDRSGRWGGDEFLVILSHCTAADTGAAVARFRSQLEEHFESRSGVCLPIRCSIGAATYSTHMDKRDLLAQADRAMYAEKRARHAPARAAELATSEAELATSEIDRDLDVSQGTLRHAAD